MDWRKSAVARLSEAAKTSPGDARWTRIGGSSVTSTWLLAMGTTRCFVKVAPAAHAEMLSAEADGLRAIAHTGTVRVPQVLLSYEADGHALLVLEWLDLAGGGRGADLGRALAALHAHTAPRFGWHRDNTIGLTPQANDWCEDWPTFFRDRRLAPQFVRAASRAGGTSLARRGEQLLQRVPALLAGHAVVPSLLHGDLWSGNAGALVDGTPVVFDPSCHFGDAECDLAMSELFGGFEPAFYRAYAAMRPFDDGYPRRRTLYNLYHVVNHFNLFGGGYRMQAEAMIDELVARP